MPTRHRSAWRRRRLEGRVGRVVVPLAIPLALAVIVGAVIAFANTGNTTVNQSALACAAAASAGTTASTGPCPSASPTASAPAVAAAAAPAVNPEAGRPDLAETSPVDPTGNAISLTQTAAQAATSMNCTLTVPANPLSAAGLATPWQLGDGCSEANPNEEAFVESTILSPGGQLQVYDPLVITQGTTPAVTPTAPRISWGSRVIINIGFNGNNLVLEGNGAVEGQCVDAFGNSIIAQTSACGFSAFFEDANAQIARGTLKVPATGTASDGRACETTESFALIDQDQSDNVVTGYLLNANGQTAQNTAANKNAVAGATLITNGSDDALLGHFVDPALRCTSFTAPDTTSPSGADDSLALNALSARQNQRGTAALLPVNDPQLLVAGQFSIGKTNAYRAETDQPMLSSVTNKNQNAATYCQDMTDIGPARLQLDAAKESVFATPVPTIGNNLSTFLGNRLAMSFTNLGCQNFGLTNPVTVTADGNGVATAVTFSTARQTATVPAVTTAAGTPASATPTVGASGGGTTTPVPTGRRGHRQNAAGM